MTTRHVDSSPSFAGTKTRAQRLTISRRQRPHHTELGAIPDDINGAEGRRRKVVRRAARGGAHASGCVLTCRRASAPSRDLPRGRRALARRLDGSEHKQSVFFVRGRMPTLSRILGIEDEGLGWRPLSVQSGVRFRTSGLRLSSPHPPPAALLNQPSANEDYWWASAAPPRFRYLGGAEWPLI